VRDLRDAFCGTPFTSRSRQGRNSTVPIGALGKREATWIARYRAPGGQERSRTFERKIDAERFLNDQEHRKARGEWIDPTLGRVRFDEYAESWLSMTTHLRPGTRANIDGRLRNHLLPHFGDMPMAAIRPVSSSGCSER